MIIRIGRAIVPLLASLLALRPAVAQHAPMPELPQARAWLQVHQPKMITGDSGVNFAIVIVDTAAKYLRSAALRLAAADLDAVQAGPGAALDLQGDTVATTLLYACVRSKTDKAPAIRPLCMLDGARVRDVESFRYFAARKVEVLKPAAAVERFGSDASNGAVVVTTDVPVLQEYTKLGVTPENFASFQTFRTSRRADQATVVVTVLMLR